MLSTWLRRKRQKGKREESVLRGIGRVFRCLDTAPGSIVILVTADEIKLTGITQFLVRRVNVWDSLSGIQELSFRPPKPR